jgi:hypothetical protein
VAVDIFVRFEETRMDRVLYRREPWIGVSFMYRDELMVLQRLFVLALVGVPVPRKEIDTFDGCRSWSVNTCVLMSLTTLLDGQRYYTH